MKAQRLGCKYVVVKLRRKSHYWVTRIENYMNPTHARLLTKGKTMSRIIPLNLFIEANEEIRL
jgi:hypothetical protein